MSLFGRLLARVGYVKLSRYGMVLGPEGPILPAGPMAPAPVFVPRALTAAPALTAAEALRVLDELTEVELTDVEIDEDDDWEWQAAAFRARLAAEESSRAALLSRPTPPPVPKRRAFIAIVPPVGEPLPAPSARALPPLAQLARSSPASRPATASTPRHPVALIPPLSGEPLPAPPRRLAKGTGQVEHDTEPMPRLFPPSPARPQPAELELLGVDELDFNDLHD